MKRMMSVVVLLMVLLGGFSVCEAQEKMLLEDAPEAVRVLVGEKYAKYKVVSVIRKKVPEEYNIEMEKGERTVSLVLDAQGTVLSRTKGRMYSFDGTETPKDAEGPAMPSMGLQ